ncbi:MAG: indolepyruvate oxidoreductase subunit beta family protein [Parvularculaceae bacterium]|nr:indolepyruvate oxidoreductase subunit beta family protein [Parvularculaceae bacterium]
MSEPRAIKIAIAAMGGQGGGVLANWIVRLGEENGFIAQATSVPGVAQRTGATVYYVELFPVDAAKAAGRDPVLALMPAPGDVDIVIAAELMEAGRAVKRGIVTKQTTLIASTHRDYAISEKIGLGDARRDGERVLGAARDAAGVFVGADMAEAAAKAGTVISAVLFGALAGCGALPIAKARYDDVIRASGRAVDANLRGFASGVEIARNGVTSAPDHAGVDRRPLTPAPSVAPLIERMQSTFPAAAHFFIREGLKRTVDFQDVRYAEEYLDRLREIYRLDGAHGGDRRDFLLTQLAAKHLALWMTYEDTIRVADLKTRSSRFSRFREDVCAEDGQIVDVREFVHPRVEEFCDILPPPVAIFILNNQFARGIVKALLGDGRRVSTTKLRGFVPLYFIASLRPIRRASHRHRVEQLRIDAWLSTIEDVAATDYALALSLVRMQRLIKGYGDTHERGLGNFNKIMAALPAIQSTADSAGAVEDLVDAALQDEDGVALQASLAALTGPQEQAA